MKKEIAQLLSDSWFTPSNVVDMKELMKFYSFGNPNHDFGYGVVFLSPGVIHPVIATATKKLLENQNQYTFTYKEFNDALCEMSIQSLRSDKNGEVYVYF